MKKAKYFALFAILLLAGIAFFLFLKKPATAPKMSSEQLINNINNMKLTSPTFEHSGNIPAKYTCDGDEMNPPLAISGVPEGAKSLALIMDDPDAPMPGGFVHWIVFNISPGVKEIDENSIPENAIEGLTSAGKAGYIGPCPPTGSHRYFFKLYALNIELNLDSSAGREDAEKAMEGHILDKAILVGLYQRQ